MTSTMVTAPTAAPTAAAAIAPATRFRRLATGWSALVGGLLTAAGFATTVWEAAPDKLSYLDSLVVDPVRSQLAALLLHYGYMGIVAALLAMAAMTRRTWRVTGNVGLVLGLVPAIALPGMLVTDFYDLAIRQTLPAAQAVATSDAAQALPLAGLIGGPLTVLTFVGLTVTAVAAARARFVPWAAVVLVPLSVAAAMLPMGPLQMVPGVLLGAFMAVVGFAAVRMSDAEWVSGERRV